jgi:hypothetical protein
MMREMRRLGVSTSKKNEVEIMNRTVLIAIVDN